MKNRALRFSTAGLLGRGCLWGAVIMAGSVTVYSAVYILSELIFSPDVARYWSATAFSMILTQIGLALMLGSIEGFVIAVGLRVLMWAGRGRVSVITAVLAGGVISLIGGLIVFLLQGMLNSEGTCADMACWVTDVVGFIMIPIAIGCLLSWGLARYVQVAS